jgi:hypothetical protein
MKAMEYEGSPIKAPHGVRDKIKFEALGADMKANGWRGEPILLAHFVPWRIADREQGYKYIALTGSHRLAAAELTGTTPKYHLVTPTIDFWGCIDNDDHLRALIKGKADKESVRLMRAEIANEGLGKNW